MNIAEKEFLSVLSAYFNGSTDFFVSEEIFPDVSLLAKKHNVLPIICETLSEKYGKEKFFQNEKILSIVQYSAQCRKTEKFLKVYRSLLESGVEAICVKGVTLRSLYKNGDLRPSSDEDLLVKPGDWPVFERVLKENGLELQKESSNEKTYFDKSTMLMIEAHKTLFFESNALGKMLDEFFSSVFSETQRVMIEKTPVLTLGAQSGLLYLVCHAFKHFIRCGFGIRQVCDIAVYIRAYKEKIDFDRLKSDLSKISAQTFFEGIVKIAENHLGFEDIEFPPLEKNIDEAMLLEDILCAGVYGKSEVSRLHSASVTLSAVTDEKKHSGLHNALFPGRKVLCATYPSLERFRFLYPWFAFLRIGKYILSVVLKKESTGTPSESMRIAKERMELFKVYKITGNDSENAERKSEK